MKKGKKKDEFGFLANIYTRRRDGKLYRIDTVPLEDMCGDSIEIDGAVVILTDTNGNILYEINKRDINDERKVTTEIAIDNINDKSIVFTLLHGDRPLKTVYINTDKKHRVERELYDCSKGGQLKKIEVPNPDKDAIIITRNNKKRTDSILFSMNRGRFISPSFSRFEKTENDGILRFRDQVFSNKEVDNKRYSTTLTGFITLDGTMTNCVYDEERECTREIGEKEGKLVDGYKKFRERVKAELDYRFEMDAQSVKRMQTFENKSLAQLNLRLQRSGKRGKYDN